MKEMNLPEEQLRSWQPRRPSAKLKHRIFATRGARPFIAVWSLRLAPAAACLLVTLSVLNQVGGMSSAGVREEPALPRPDVSQIACLQPGFYQEHNELSAAVTFDWTNRSGSTSSISSLSPGKAN